MRALRSPLAVFLPLAVALAIPMAPHLTALASASAGTAAVLPAVSPAAAPAAVPAAVAGPPSSLRYRPATQKAVVSWPWTYTVAPGDTLSSIAQKAYSRADAWTLIYASNKALIGAWPMTITPGEHLVLARLTGNPPAAPPMPKPPPAPALAVAPAAAAPAVAAAPQAQVQVSGYSGFQACVISRESGGQAQIMNSSGHYGLYQFSYSTWVAYGGNGADFGHASVAEQNQVFANTMATPGGAGNWAPYDGC